jgi:hypothetical protein
MLFDIKIPNRKFQRKNQISRLRSSTAIVCDSKACAYAKASAARTAGEANSKFLQSFKIQITGTSEKRQVPNLRIQIKPKVQIIRMLEKLKFKPRF